MDAPTVGIPVIDWLLGVLADNGYVLTFVAAFSENIFLIGSFVPGETVQAAAGFVSSAGRLDPWWVWVAGFTASFAGGNVSYAIGRRGGRPLIERLMSRFRIKHERLRAAEAYFAKHGSETVFLARWIAGIKNLVPAIAGMSRMPLFWFELYSLLGALVYTTLLVWGGYLLGENFTMIIDVVRTTAWGALALIALAVAYTRWRLWRRRKQHDLESEATGSLDPVSGPEGDRGPAA